jgi:hypothetical protein
MATPLSEFHPFIRVTLGDLNADAFGYSATNLDTALRMVVLKGQLPGYALTTGRDAITPDLTEATDWARLLTLASLTFVLPEAEATSYRTRAMSESFAGRKDLLFSLRQELYEADQSQLFRNGTDGWQDLRTFVAGCGHSLPIWQALTELKTNTAAQAVISVP